MRYVERLQYLASLLYYSAFIVPETDATDMPKLILIGIMGTFIIGGYYWEGIRIHQLPFYLGLIVHSCIAWPMEG